MKCHDSYCHIYVTVDFICFEFSIYTTFSPLLFSVRWSSTHLQGTSDPVWPPESHYHRPSDSHFGVYCYWKPQTYRVLEQTGLEPSDFQLSKHVLCDLSIILPLYSCISPQTLLFFNNIAPIIEVHTRIQRYSTIVQLCLCVGL